MSTAPRRIRQILRLTQRDVKPLALLLRARVLPIRTKRMTERAALLTRELLHQRLPTIQTPQQPLRIFTPEHSPMLHPRARKTLHF
jgi:hypothetical protein